MPYVDVICSYSRVSPRFKTYVECLKGKKVYYELRKIAQIEKVNETGQKCQMKDVLKLNCKMIRSTKKYLKNEDRFKNFTCNQY